MTSYNVLKNNDVPVRRYKNFKFSQVSVFTSFLHDGVATNCFKNAALKSEKMSLVFFHDPKQKTVILNIPGLSSRAVSSVFVTLGSKGFLPKQSTARTSMNVTQCVRKKLKCVKIQSEASAATVFSVSLELSVLVLVST